MPCPGTAQGLIEFMLDFLPTELSGVKIRWSQHLPLHRSPIPGSNLGLGLPHTSQGGLRGGRMHCTNKIINEGKKMYTVATPEQTRDLDLQANALPAKMSWRIDNRIFCCCCKLVRTFLCDNATRDSSIRTVSDNAASDNSLALRN